LWNVLRGIGRVTSENELPVARDFRPSVFLGRRGGAKFESAGPAFRVLDLVSRLDGFTANVLTRELGVSLSACYHLINVFIEEGYLKRVREWRIAPEVAENLCCVAMPAGVRMARWGTL
jgi:hypothetical protein